MSKSRMAGDKLKDIKFEDGLSSLPDNYDKGVANRVISGSWGEDDLKRYQHRMRAGEAGKHSYTPYKDSDSSEDSSSSSSAGSNDSANFSQDVIKDLPKIGLPAAVANSFQEQNVQQDNDISTTIDGDNNVVNNNQDNSISQFGGGSESYLGSWMDKYRFNKRVA